MHLVAESGTIILSADVEPVMSLMLVFILCHGFHQYGCSMDLAFAVSKLSMLLSMLLILDCVCYAMSGAIIVVERIWRLQCLAPS